MGIWLFGDIPCCHSSSRTQLRQIAKFRQKIKFKNSWKWLVIAIHATVWHFFSIWNNAKIRKENHLYLLKLAGKIREITREHIFWRVLAIRSQRAVLPPAINPCRARAFAQAGVWHGDIAHKIESPFCSTAKLVACQPACQRGGPAILLWLWWLLLCAANYVDCCAHSCHNDPIWNISFVF